MTPVRPRDIIARFVSKIGILPGIVAGAPGHVVGCSKSDLGHATQEVVRNGEERGCRPAAGLYERASWTCNGIEMNRVAAEKKARLVQQRRRISLRQLDGG